MTAGVPERIYQGTVQPITGFVMKKRSTMSTLSTFTYHGEALPGTASSAAAWLIWRETNSNGNIDHAASSGRPAGFQSVWDNAIALTYV